MHDLFGTPMSISAICDLLWKFQNSGNQSLRANLENLPLGSRCAEPPDPLTPVWETSYNYYDHVINYGFHELSHLAIVNEIINVAICFCFRIFSL